MATPESTLEGICVGGRITGLCADGSDIEEFPDLLVRADLIAPAGASSVIDPSNAALVFSRRVENLITTQDGCWCTCPLKPNVGTEGGEHLLPEGSFWRISVFTATPQGNAAAALGQPFDIVLDADADYAGLMINTSCGLCVNATALLDIVEFPPPPTFCDAVGACFVFQVNGVTVPIDTTGDNIVVDLPTPTSEFRPGPSGTIIHDDGLGNTCTLCASNQVSQLSVPFNDLTGTFNGSPYAIPGTLEVVSPCQGNDALVQAHYTINGVDELSNYVIQHRLNGGAWIGMAPLNTLAGADTNVNESSIVRLLNLPAGTHNVEFRLVSFDGTPAVDADMRFFAFTERTELECV